LLNAKAVFVKLERGFVNTRTVFVKLKTVLLKRKRVFLNIKTIFVKPERGLLNTKIVFVKPGRVLLKRRRGFAIAKSVSRITISTTMRIVSARNGTRFPTDYQSLTNLMQRFSNEFIRELSVLRMYPFCIVVNW
jgi:hypothetical protein